MFFFFFHFVFSTSSSLSSPLQKEPPPPFLPDGGPRQRLVGQGEHGVYRRHLRQARVQAQGRVQARGRTTLFLCCCCCCWCCFFAAARTSSTLLPRCSSSSFSTFLPLLFLLHAVPQQAQARHAEERVVDVRGVLGAVGDPPRVTVLRREHKPGERGAVDPCRPP